MGHTTDPEPSTITTTTNRDRLEKAATTATSSAINRDRLEKPILRYIQYCTQHVKKMAENKIQLAKAQMEEFTALEDFQQIAIPSQ